MSKKIQIRIRIILLLSILCGLFSTSIISAQSAWYKREKVNAIYLEINKPFTPSLNLNGEKIGLDAWSSSLFLTGRYSLKNNQNITFVADIPVAHGYINSSLITNGSEWVLGNPYLGAEFDIPKTPAYFELGLRIPIVSDNNFVAKLAGRASDIERGYAFFSHLFPVCGAVNYETVSENKILFKARAGINLWFETDDTLGFESNPAVNVNYQLQTGYVDKNLKLIFNIIGREEVSEGSELRGKSHFLEYGVSIMVPYKKIRPAISFRIPGTDRGKEALNYVLGLNFGYVF